MVSCDASEIDAQVKKLTEPCQDPRLRDYPNRFVAMTVDLEDGRFFSFFGFLFWGERGKGREGKGGEGRGGGKEGKGGKEKGRKREWERENEKEREDQKERWKGRAGKVKRKIKEKKEEKGEKQVALMLWACKNYWKNLRTLIRGLFPNRS